MIPKDQKRILSRMKNTELRAEITKLKDEIKDRHERLQVLHNEIAHRKQRQIEKEKL